ncbi:hypothetical protein [Thermosyntropha sp.]|uniref:hypothetical protein n=1 Tax=Thermosyntropha sp. TaxID=2740820 RepID=UPI0025F4CFF5|nr:hypothetical protein [Thermosyntropha sp.]MBO8158476.1 hypothetical protein [Thermosyntropha sp.]
MLAELSLKEIELLKAFQALGPVGQKECSEYIKYLLTKQYKRELMMSIFNNKLIHNLLHGLLHMVEKDDFDVIQAQKRVMQIKELYYGIFEDVHTKYTELVDDLDTNEIVREFGKNGFTSLENAFVSGDIGKIRYEVIDFFQQYEKFSQKKDIKHVVAV